MPTADQVCLTLPSDGNMRHGSSKQHAAEQSIQPSRLLQASGVQSQAAAAPWGKVALSNFRRLDSSDSAGAKRPSSAASGLHEHFSHGKAKHRPAAQRDNCPICRKAQILDLDRLQVKLLSFHCNTSRRVLASY